MKLSEWHISTGRGDFLPLLIGCLMLLISVPAFCLLLWFPERNSQLIGLPVLVVLAAGAIAGLAFLILGLQACAAPGSVTYRIAHGRLFRP